MSIYLKAIAAKTVVLKQGSLLSSKCLLVMLIATQDCLWGAYTLYQ